MSLFGDIADVLSNPWRGDNPPPLRSHAKGDTGRTIEDTTQKRKRCHKHTNPAQQVKKQQGRAQHTALIPDLSSFARDLPPTINTKSIQEIIAHGLAKNTQQNYSSAVSIFQKFCNDNNIQAVITAGMIEKTRETLRG
jgi:hypothetical protein